MPQPRSKYAQYYDLTPNKGTCKTCKAVIQRSGGSSFGLLKHLKQHGIKVQDEPVTPSVVTQKTLNNFVQRETLEELVSREASQHNATFAYLGKSNLIRRGLSTYGHEDKAPRNHRSVSRMVDKSADMHRDIVRNKLKNLLKHGHRFCVITDEWTCTSKRRRYADVTLHIKGKIFNLNYKDILFSIRS